MSETTKLTAKLEEAIADAQKGCLYPARCEHCAAVGTLTLEVLAGRKALTQARKALEADAYRTDKAETVMDALCMLEAQVAKALAALEVPDGE